jgi:hypothetical protein
MTTSAQGSSLPPINFNISTQSVVAKPRKLKMKWSLEAVDDLVGPTRPTNILDLLNDALSDPNYDPSDKDYKGLWRWRSDGRLATPEEIGQWTTESQLVANIADEMTAEIDREVMAALGASAASRPPTAPPIVVDGQFLDPIPTHMEKVIAETPAEEWCKDAARRIISENLS